MAEFTYSHAKHLLGSGGLDLSTADLRMALVMTNTTVDTEEDVTTLSGFTTLDEHDGSGYARVALTGESYAKDAANDRSELTCNAIVFSSLGSGTRQAQAALLYAHVTDDTDSIPVAYFDSGGFPFDTTGSDVTLNINTEGLLQVR